VARTLNPNLNIWKAGEPVVRYWIERKLGPIGKLEQLGGSALSLGRLALRVPEILNEVHDFTRKMDALTDQPSPQRWHAPALWIGALALVVIALKLVLK
jgi:ubiquinone biosynthesis protein